MENKPKFSARRQRLKRHPRDNTKQLALLEQFKNGKINESKVISELEETNLPERHLPLKENMSYVKESLKMFKNGELEPERAEGRIRFFMRKYTPFIPKNNTNKPRNNSRNNSAKNMNRKSTNNKNMNTMKKNNKPANKPASKPASKPANKPASKSVSKPASKPASKSASKPASKSKK